MAKRVTPEEIVEMHRLYARLGNYAAVGRELGRSGTTVAKYIKMKGTPDIVRHTFKEVVRGQKGLFFMTGWLIFLCVCFVLGVWGYILDKTGYNPHAKKSDEELIIEYNKLTRKIAAEVRAGSRCQGIGSRAAVTACNNRIDSYRMSAESIAKELERRNYKVDRSLMNGHAVRQESGSASVVGRAVVGGIIAGPTGAIIGAASAIDKNQKNASK